MAKINETIEQRLEKKLDRVVELLEYIVVLKLHCDGKLGQNQISKRIKKDIHKINGFLKDVEKKGVKNGK